MYARHSFQRLLFHILLKKEKASHRSLTRLLEVKGSPATPTFPAYENRKSRRVEGVYIIYSLASRWARWDIVLFE
jgi:hypothetical protein